jgi:hypothetical protein
VVSRPIPLLLLIVHWLAAGNAMGPPDGAGARPRSSEHRAPHSGIFCRGGAFRWVENDSHLKNPPRQNQPEWGAQKSCR